MLKVAEDRSNARWRVLTVVAAVALSLGCQGKLAPAVAMAGTTIAIPLDGWTLNGLFRVNPLVIGFGGEPGYGPEDRQRGSMRYTLDDGTNQYPLHTRFTTRMLADSAAPIGSSVGGSAGFQLASMVDIPGSSTPTEEVPAGHYTIIVERILPDGSVDPANYEYNAELEVIQDDPTKSGFTPIEGWSKFLPGWSATVPNAVIPHPELRIDFDTAVYAIELSVDVPSTITPKDAFSRQYAGLPVSAPIAWFANSNGTVTISAAANGSNFNSIALSFILVGTQPVVAGDFSNLSVVAAYDQDGVPISNVQLTAGVY